MSTLTPHVAPAAPLWRRLKARPLKTAGALLEHFDVRTPHVDVESMIEKLGINLLRVSEPGWRGAVRSERDTATIWIRREDSAGGQRFTMAHELGHLFLHNLTEAHRDTSDYMSSSIRMERQANRFAADLLMPFWMLDEYVMRNVPRSMLAQRFQVSEAAMEFRLREWAGERGF